MNNTPSQEKGLTLLEIIIVVAITAIIAGGVFSMFSAFIMDTQVDDAAQEMIYALRKANTNTMVRLNDLPWGVRFDDTTSQFTFFAGSTYATRAIQYDAVTILPTSVTFSQISLNGGGKEVVFRKVAGDTAQYGTLKVRSTNGKERTITINQLGQIEVS